MADSLLNLYLGDDTSKTPDVKSGSLLDMYLAPTEEPKSIVNEQMVPRLDTSSGQAKLIMVPKSQQDAELKKQSENDTLLNKAKTAISDLGSAFGESYLRNLKGTVKTTGQGMGELVSGSPVTGLSRVGLGMLGTATAATSLPTIFEGVQNVLSKASGNPDFAKKATDIGGLALPVGPMKAGIEAIAPSSRAFKDLVNIVGKDNIPQVVQELKSNSRLSIADVSLPAQMATQKLITTEGPHQSTFQKFIKSRIESAKGAVEDIYNDTMGVPVDVLKKLNSYKQAAKDVGSKAINPAVKGAGPVDLSGVIQDIDNTLKPGVNSVISAGQPLPMQDIQKELAGLRTFLTNDKSVRTDANSLHSFQSSLRSRADDLLNSPNGKDRQIGYALMNVRNKIVDAIDAASPQTIDAAGNSIGTYKSALGRYRDEKDIESAFTKGYQITRNRPGQWTDRPEFWQEWINQATPQEKAAAVEGGRVAIDHQINAMKFGARRGTDVPEVEFNKQKLAMLMPEKDTNEMFKRISDERKIADTNSKLVQNSQTAMRMKSDSRIDLPEQKKLGLPTLISIAAEIGGNLSAGVPGLGPATFAGLTGANYAKNKVARSLHMQKNNELTNLITASGADRDNLISGLESVLKTPKLSLINGAKLSLPVALNP